MIWLHTLGDSHSTQLQGPIGRFSGEFIQLKIYFQPGVLHNKLIRSKFPSPSPTSRTSTCRILEDHGMKQCRRSGFETCDFGTIHSLQLQSKLRIFRT